MSFREVYTSFIEQIVCFIDNLKVKWNEEGEFKGLLQMQVTMDVKDRKVNWGVWKDFKKKNIFLLVSVKTFSLQLITSLCNALLETSVGKDSIRYLPATKCFLIRWNNHWTAYLTKRYRPLPCCIWHSVDMDRFGRMVSSVNIL